MKSNQKKNWIVTLAKEYMSGVCQSKIHCLDDRMFWGGCLMVNRVFWVVLLCNCKGVVGRALVDVCQDVLGG